MKEQEKFGIVTDTASGITPEKAKKLDIGEVPIYVILGKPGSEEVFRDLIDITAAEVKKKFDETGEAPKTSGAVEKDFLEAYRTQLDRRDRIVSIHISKNFSQVTHESALSATRQLIREFELPENSIIVVDSGQVGPALGFLVKQAIESRNCGVNFETTVAHINEQRNYLLTIGTLNRLDFLKKTGRIPKIFIPLLQNAMNRSKRSPIIQIYNGEWDTPVDPARIKFDWQRLPKKEEAMVRMAELVSEKELQFGRKIGSIAIFHFDAIDLAEEEAFYIKKKSNGRLNPEISESPASFAAAGPGFVGVGIQFV